MFPWSRLQKYVCPGLEFEFVPQAITKKTLSQSIFELFVFYCKEAGSASESMRYRSRRRRLDKNAPKPSPIGASHGARNVK
jgi:hypothetical protein